MAHVTRKLSNSVEGALAGGGDPATSPLYIFGPFLRLIVVAGVAQITFGASVWLAVFTIAMVSAMYRLVMSWVTDGSGGSGLSEEEFGSWAVKTNAAITFIEYTLTFLVSMAALVTFIADRLPVLNEALLGIQYRTIIAILLSIVTGWLVNRGPRVAALAFGPATALVLILLWLMDIVAIWRYGLHLPDFNLAAFAPANLGFTFGGYARILAVMTGIEVFANLVAAYQGDAAEKSRKAFGSLLIIMGTTAVTMLILGPVIYQLADPTDSEVSVFTQTMDQLLPAPLPLVGTLIGVAVLLSAAAASAQGLQNLFRGLKFRHYVPAVLGQTNRHGVADKPVWLEIGLVAICFLLFGTHEETYLAIYAAGVFILLSMTAWAASKRLLRQLRTARSTGLLLTLLGTIIAALLTTSATLIIFVERFTEGAWTYFIFVPLLYAAFTYFRHHLGEPSQVQERLGRILTRPTTPILPRLHSQQERATLERILVPLDGSRTAEKALPLAQALARQLSTPLSLLSVGADNEGYLEIVRRSLQAEGVPADCHTGAGAVADTIHLTARSLDSDLIVMSTHGLTGVRRLLLGSVAGQVVERSSLPVLLVRPVPDATRPICFDHIVVTLDGSDFAERVLPYVQTLAHHCAHRVTLLHVADAEHAPDLAPQMGQYLNRIAGAFDGPVVIAQQQPQPGENASQVIINYCQAHDANLLMLATRGRGGLQRALLGSVADSIVRQVDFPVFLVPIVEQRLAEAG
ncbi:MAG: universal stress protein [Anaerolineales bacterium]|nr:universal stress protein [Anaerolineales bacterium]